MVLPFCGSQKQSYWSGALTRTIYFFFFVTSNGVRLVWKNMLNFTRLCSETQIHFVCIYIQRIYFNTKVLYSNSWTNIINNTHTHKQKWPLLKRYQLRNPSFSKISGLPGSFYATLLFSRRIPNNAFCPYCGSASQLQRSVGWGDHRVGSFGAGWPVFWKVEPLPNL